MWIGLSDLSKLQTPVGMGSTAILLLGMLGGCVKFVANFRKERGTDINSKFQAYITLQDKKSLEQDLKIAAQSLKIEELQAKNMQLERSLYELQGAFNEYKYKNPQKVA